MTGSTHGGARPGSGRRPGLQPPTAGFWADEKERHVCLWQHPEYGERGWTMINSDAQIGRGRVFHATDGVGLPAHLAIRPSGERRVFAVGEVADALAWVEADDDGA